MTIYFFYFRNSIAISSCRSRLQGKETGQSRRTASSTWFCSFSYGVSTTTAASNSKSSIKLSVTNFTGIENEISGMREIGNDLVFSICVTCHGKMTISLNIDYMPSCVHSSRKNLLPECSAKGLSLSSF